MKKRFKTAIIIATVGLLSYKQYEISTQGLNVVYGEKNIGIVRDREEVMEVVDSLEAELSENLKKDIKIDKEISFVETHIKKEELAKRDDIKEAIEEDLSYCAVAYAIKVDGKEVAYLDKKEKANQALDKYKGLVVGPMGVEVDEMESVEILEDVEVVEKEIPLAELDDIDTAISKIRTGDMEEKKHIIKDDENFWTLAEHYGVSMESIENANPEKDTKKLKPQDEIIIPLVKPLITVVTYEEKKIEEETDFETDYEIDKDLYVDTEEVRVAGEKGKIEKEIEVERRNGLEVAEKVINEKIIKEPVKQVIAKGTKPIPEGTATGSFSTPTRGSVSSPFGHRWGKLHGGIDIAARIGEPIKAADGGTVTYAQFNNGGYGYMVEIDHGNGYVTKYAHCSKLYVKNGAKINKGDTIAAVGNTGRSTGPHLHFEVRKNGEPQDPKGYLN